MLFVVKIVPQLNTPNIRFLHSKMHAYGMYRVEGINVKPLSRTEVCASERITEDRFIIKLNNENIFCDAETLPSLNVVYIYIYPSAVTYEAISVLITCEAVIQAAAALGRRHMDTRRWPISTDQIL